MTAGMPGTGIGGLFYLLAALFMPFIELWKTLTGRANVARRKAVVRQCIISGGILTTLWLTGLALGLIPSVAAEISHTNNPALRVFYIAPVVVAFVTLVAVLAAVEVARLLFGSRQTAAVAVGEESEAA